MWFSVNQPLGAWDVSNVTNMAWMFDRAGLSPANYDHLLLGWSQLDLQPGVNFDAGNSWYTRDAASARRHIIETYGWSITDMGSYEGRIALLFGGTVFLVGLVVIWVKRRSKKL